MVHLINLYESNFLENLYIIQIYNYSNSSDTHFFKKKNKYCISSKEGSSVYYKILMLDAAFNRGQGLSEGGA